MKSKKVVEVVSLSFLILFVVGIIGVTSFISKNIFYALKGDDNSFVLKDIASSDLPVINEVKKVVEKPFNDEKTNINVNFYSKTSSKEEQEKALILYDNTYMPSTGIIYSNENAFDILAVAEGKIEDIKEDEIFGTIITIKHTNNLTTKYSSIKDAKVNVGDTVNTGEIIGTSGVNKVTSVSENMLYFEMIHNGKYVNPEEYYNKEIEEMN
ncbi:MAG: M23 family metallopeptidase [Bacilli bacterium]|nr:M23 family metallopeptidase [Bacilli bacterium]